MSNKYQGKVEVTLDDKTYTLQYKYDAISEILSKYGKDALSKIYEMTPTDLADLAAIGLKADGVTAAQIIDISPPFFPLAKCIDDALGYSYFGADGTPKPAADTKKNPEKQTTTKSKNT